MPGVESEFRCREIQRDELNSFEGADCRTTSPALLTNPITHRRTRRSDSSVEPRGRAPIRKHHKDERQPNE